MKRFNYKAKEKETGKVIKGNIQAENEQTAGRLLIEQGLIPQSVVEEGENDPFVKVKIRLTWRYAERNGQNRKNDSEKSGTVHKRIEFFHYITC